MTPSTQGFAWEGFFRSLQGDLTAFVGFLVLVLVAFMVVRWMINRAGDGSGLEAGEIRVARGWARRIALACVFVAVGAMTWRAVSFASINRMPRSDIDRSGVYEQMNTNAPRR